MEDIETASSSSFSNTFGDDIIEWSLVSDQDGSVSPSSDSGQSCQRDCSEFSGSCINHIHQLTP